jgi:ABC-2 type transport system ATP-binding protein
MVREVVRTEGLVKWYGDVQALDCLDLRCAGRINGLVGPNGAGKSTTILILLGLVQPTEGSASVLGLDCLRSSLMIRKRVGVLHEKPRFPQQVTGSRFLRHVMRFRQIDGDETAVVTNLLNELDLGGAGDRAIGTYSAGMVQRLGLAQALIGNPELVILDEPTANLDPMGRIAVLQRIKELSQDKEVRFLVSTHILPELERVCDWISIVNLGRVVDQGTVSDLLARYTGGMYQVETDHPRLLAKTLASDATASVLSLRIRDGKIICTVRDSDVFQHRIVAVASQLGLALRGLEAIGATLENVFLKALEKEEPNGEGG